MLDIKFHNYFAKKGRNGEILLIHKDGITSANKIAPVLSKLHGRAPGLLELSSAPDKSFIISKNIKTIVRNENFSGKDISWNKCCNY